MAITLTGGRAWDGVADASAPAEVAIADGRVVPVAPDGARRIDVAGGTVIPGLIEAHTHLCFNAGADWRAVYDADGDARMLLRMSANGMAMLRAGITTVRDLGAPTALAVALRDALRAGVVEGPDLLVAGAPVTTTGGHCHFMGGEADGELGVRVAVRERAKAGVDWIKVMASGGNMTPGSNPMAAQFTAGEMRAIVEEAHRLGLRVAAHCHGIAGIRVAVEGGVDVLEHCSFQTPRGSEPDDALIAEIARRGIVVSPTASVSLGRLAASDPERYERRAGVLRALVAHGCRLVMSTDSGIPGVPHAALGAGIRALAEAAGLDAVSALRLATSEAARWLGLDDRGVIAPGRRADLLVVDGDPTQDLAALDRVRLVIAGGRVVA